MHSSLSEDNTKVLPLDHLGLISATLDKLGLIEKINSRLPISKAKGSKVTMGERVAAMILNGLGFIDDRLYMFPDFLRTKPIDRLLGDHLSADDFNDDTLGRCLDAIYAYGTTKLFSELAFEIGIAHNLLGRSVHLDTTTLSVSGEFAANNSLHEAINQKEAENNKPISENEQSNVVDKHPIHITQGYAKNKRFDLKQMVLTLATTGASGFPVWMEAHNGNASDKQVLPNAADRMKKLCESLKDAPSFLYVGDSAMYENCVKKGHSLTWLSRVPASIQEAKKIMSLPSSNFIWEDLPSGYKISPLRSNYGKVDQRWLLVFSKKAYYRELITLRKHIAKEKEDLTKSLKALENQSFSCASDSLKVAHSHIKKCKYHKVEYTVVPITGYIGKGRPKKGDAPKVTSYRVESRLTEDIDKVSLATETKGRFILATNELDELKLPTNELLSEYKEQSKTESGFRFIKGNAFEVSSLFLKKDTRIEALMMVMTLCLMVYSLAQYHLRTELSANEQTVPNQLKKQTATPTMAWICRLFYSVSIVQIAIEHGVNKEIVANLNPVLKQIIKHFGQKSMFIYGLI